MKLNILSIDWDYFFPCMDYFDWGHSENKHFMAFSEMLWELRAAKPMREEAWHNRDKLELDKTIYEYLQLDKKRLKEFTKNNFTGFAGIACETHQDLFNIFEKLLKDTLNIWNFDAHHDAGYVEMFGGDDIKANETAPANCGNWAFKLHQKKLLLQYNIIYPIWRKENPESNKAPDWASVHYEIPKDLPDMFEYIFICRSSAWTPSWNDTEWMQFINHMETSCIGDFITLQYISKIRQFNYEKSLDNRKAMMEAKNEIST